MSFDISTFKIFFDRFWSLAIRIQRYIEIPVGLTRSYNPRKYFRLLNFSLVRLFTFRNITLMRFCCEELNNLMHPFLNNKWSWIEWKYVNILNIKFWYKFTRFCSAFGHSAVKSNVPPSPKSSVFPLFRHSRVIYLHTSTRLLLLLLLWGKWFIKFAP